MAISRDTGKDCGNSTASGTSVTVAAPGGTFDAGKLLIACCFTSTDPANLTRPSGYSIAQTVNQFGTVGIYVAYKENSTGAETGQIWTCGTNQELFAVGLQYSGALTASALDKAPAGTHSNGVLVTTQAGPATGVLAQANELILTFLGLGGVTASPSCSGGGILAKNQGNRAIAFDQIVAATTSVTHTPSWANINYANVATVTFKAALVVPGRPGWRST